MSSLETSTFEFGVAVGIHPGQTVLGVRGEVDVLTAPALQAALRPLVAGPRPSEVEIDLAGLTFMDASGIGVLAEGAAVATTAGGTITIRSAPVHVARLLELAGLDHLLVGEPGAGGPGGGTTLEVAIGRMRRDSDVLVGALELVTATALEAIGPADGVSISLRRHGRLVTVAATNETVRRMDASQYEVNEGPCVAAATVGEQFLVASVARERRWPSFVPAAAEEGIGSILSTPLLGDGPTGALNVYATAERVFGRAERAVAGVFAGRAAGLVAGAGADLADEAVAALVTAALTARELIARAQGVLMGRDRMTVEDAAAALHRRARARAIPVAVHAADVIAGATDRA